MSLLGIGNRVHFHLRGVVIMFRREMYGDSLHCYVHIFGGRFLHSHFFLGEFHLRLHHGRLTLLEYLDLMQFQRPHFGVICFLVINLHLIEVVVRSAHAVTRLFILICLLIRLAL